MDYSSFIKSLVKIKDLDLSDEIIDNKMNFSSRIKELIKLNQGRYAKLYKVQFEEELYT